MQSLHDGDPRPGRRLHRPRLFDPPAIQIPGSQLIARLYRVEGEIPQDFLPVDEFFYRHHITPLLPVSDFRRVPQLEATQPRFVNSGGKWIK